MKVFHQVHHIFTVPGVEIPSRFIRQENRWDTRERKGDRNSRLFSPRKLRWVPCRAKPLGLRLQRGGILFAIDE